MIKRRAALACLAAPLAALAPGAWGASDDFPAKNITLVVPYPAGGANDLLARGVKVQWEAAWGKSVLIENKPGGYGSIGTEFVSRQPGDGHSLLMGSVATHAINPALYPKHRYSAERDFVPVAYMGSTPLILTVHPSLGVKTVQELIAYAKKHPGKLSYASVGLGSAAHLSAELFKQKAGVDIVHVPYRGISQASTDLVGGQIEMAFSNVLNVLPYLQTGKLVALGITGKDRLAVLPKIPPIGDTLPGYEVDLWWGVFAPAKTPQTVVDKLNAEANRYLDSKETRARWEREGITLAPMSSTQFKELVARDATKWTQVIKAAKVVAE